MIEGGLEVVRERAAQPPVAGEYASEKRGKLASRGKDLPRLDGWGGCALSRCGRRPR